MITSASVIGNGTVGNAIFNCLKNKKITTFSYDIKNTINTFEQILTSDIMFICLPTPFCSYKNEYNKNGLYSHLQLLIDYNYKGIILIKSTLEPGTTETLSQKYNLKLFHNPEFLSAKTAIDDFTNQKHIIIGQVSNVNKYDTQQIIDFYNCYFSNAKISVCNSTESESAKIFCNSFYSVKIQFFNELYFLSQKINCDFEIIRSLMLSNDWINPMHTQVPGPDGMFSYGGSCFPKDNLALIEFMKKNKSPHLVLEATKKERDTMRLSKDLIT